MYKRQERGSEGEDEIVEWGRPIERQRWGERTDDDTLSFDLVKPKKPQTEYTKLYGTASPPTSYGGYGGNAAEEAK